MPDQEDPFKKYGGNQIEDPFKKYGGKSIEEPSKKKVSSIGSLVGGGVTPSGKTSLDKQSVIDYVKGLGGNPQAPITSIPADVAAEQVLPFHKTERISDKQAEDEALRRFTSPSAINDYSKTVAPNIPLHEDDPIGNKVGTIQADMDAAVKLFNPMKDNPTQLLNELKVKNTQAQLLKELYIGSGQEAKGIVNDLYTKGGGVVGSPANAPFNAPAPNIDQVPLEEIKAKLPDTMTAQIAFDKYSKKRNLDEVWAKTNNIYEAAAAYAGENLADLSEAKRGRLVDDFINDPIVREKAAQDGKFNNAVAGAKMEQYNNNPTFVIQKTATKISQKLEDERMTGWFYSNPGQETVQKAVDMLKEKGEWSSEDELAYQKDIAPLVKAGKADKIINTTDLLHNIGRGVQEGFEGVDASARDLMNKTVGGGLFTGSSWMQDLGLMETNKDRTKRLEQEQLSRTGVEPKGLVSNITAGGGHFLGFTAPMILAGAANIPEAATMIMMFEGKNADKSREMFKDDVGKQNSYTLATTGIDVMLAPFLHTNKAAEGIKTLFKKDAAEIVNKLGSKEITEAEAAGSFLQKATNYIGKVAKGNFNNANVLTAFTFAHNTADALAGKRNFSLEGEINEGIKNYGSNFLSGTFLSGATALKGRNGSYANEINRLAENPERTRELIKDDPEKLKNFDYLLKVREQLSNRVISEEQRNQYAFKALQKKVLEEKIKNSADKTLASEEEKKVKEIEIEQKIILDPDMGLQKIVKEFYDVEDLLPQGVREMLEVDKEFSPSKVGGVLKYIAQQANGLREDWSVDPAGRKADMSKIPDEFIKMANERWAKEIEAAQPKEEVHEVKLQQPIEVIKEEPAEELLPEGNKVPPETPQEKSGVSVIMPEDNRPPNVVPLVKGAGEDGGVGGDVESTAEWISENRDKLGEVDRFGNVKDFLTEKQNKDFYESNDDWDTYVAKLYHEGKLRKEDAYKIEQSLPTKEVKPTTNETIQEGTIGNESVPAETKIADEGKIDENSQAADGGKEPPQAPPVEPVVEGGDDRGVAGIAAIVRKERAAKLGTKVAEAGEGWSAEDAIKRGEELRKQGIDPDVVLEDFNKSKAVSGDMMAVVQNRAFELVQATEKAGDDYLNNPTDETRAAYAKAQEVENKWMQDIKPMQTEWQKIGAGQQGVLKLDTNSYSSVKKEFSSITDKEPTKEQEVKIKELTERNKKLQKEADDLEAKVIELTEKAFNSEGVNPKSKIKDINQWNKNAHKAVDKFFNFGSEGLTSNPLAAFKPIVHAAVDAITLAVKGGKLLADAINEQIGKFKETDFYKGLPDSDKKDYVNKMEVGLPEVFKSASNEGKKLQRLEKQLKDLQEKKVRQKDVVTEDSQEVKDLKDIIFEEKKKLGLIPSKALPKKPEAQLTAAEKSIRQKEKQLEDLQAGKIKQQSEKREITQEEKDLNEKIFEKKKELGLIPSKGFPKTTELPEEKFNSTEPTGMGRSKMDKPLTKQEQIEQDNIELEGLQKKIAGKKDNKFSIEEAKSIWDYAKKNYLDKGVSYRDMIKQVGTDLGLSWKQVSEAVTAPKTKPISLAMWKKQGELNRAKNATKIWIDQQSRSIYVRAWLKASAAIRGAQVFGHAGVFMGTHAGMTLAQPTTWRHTIPAFFNAYKFAYGNEGAYEKSMQELKSRELYDRFKKLGLKNDPDQVNAEEYQKDQNAFTGMLKRIGMQGIKGFNALKVLRQDLAEHHYNKLTEEQKKDDGAVRSIVRLVNNATGATNLKLPDWVNEVSFAGGMEAARWGKLTRNPMRATAIAIKALRNPEKATTEEKVFAKIWASRVGEQLATYTSLLFANAAIQGLVNPSNPTNILNPNKKDWLRPKFGDITVDPTSGMMSTVDFIKNMGQIPFKNGKELHGDTKSQAWGKALIGRTRGKLAPAYSTLYDLVTQTDYNGNQLPLSNIKPDASHRNIGWLEWSAQRLPIPVAEGLHEMFQSAEDNGTKPTHISNVLQALLLAGISGTTGARASESSKERPTPFTEEDEKNPSFKYFLDKDMELPNTSLRYEKVKDNATKTIKTIQEFPKEVQDEYTAVHKEYLEKELRDIIRHKFVYEDDYGGLSIHKPDGKSTRLELDGLDKEKLAKVLSIAQSRATTLAKKKVFRPR